MGACSDRTRRLVGIATWQRSLRTGGKSHHGYQLFCGNGGQALVATAKGLVCYHQRASTGYGKGEHWSLCFSRRRGGMCERGTIPQANGCWSLSCGESPREPSPGQLSGHSTSDILDVLPRSASLSALSSPAALSPMTAISEPAWPSHRLAEP